MRDLRVVGLAPDGGTVVAETVPQRSGEHVERFALAVDEHLHAAIRGDLARLGQAQTQQEGQMRPREIQTRVRAGASVQDLAAEAEVPVERIERFAHPVLLERSRAAELARQAHPMRSDGPDVRTLDDVVADTFRVRGHEPQTLSWDSWRGENGRWVVQLRWEAGRTDNRARWTYHPGAHGGTVSAVDDDAAALIDPDAGKPLHTVPDDGPAEATDTAEQADWTAQHDEQHEEEQPPAALAVPDDASRSRSGAGPGQPAAENRGTEPKGGNRRRNHPSVPSWEDVLLGTRSARD